MLEAGMTKILKMGGEIDEIIGAWVTAAPDQFNRPRVTGPRQRHIFQAVDFGDRQRRHQGASFTRCDHVFQRLKTGRVAV